MNKYNFWNNFTKEISLLNSITLKNTLKEFWFNIIEPLNKNQMVYIIFKVKFSDNTYASISYLQTINKSMF